MSGANGGGYSNALNIDAFSIPSWNVMIAGEFPNGEYDDFCMGVEGTLLGGVLFGLFVLFVRLFPRRNDVSRSSTDLLELLDITRLMNDFFVTL